MFAVPALADSDNECKGNPHHCVGQGPAGPPGADGMDGMDGMDGKDGRDGIDGLNGMDGSDGKDGRDGIDGIDGIDGMDGEVPTEFITNTTNSFNEQRNILNRYDKWFDGYRDYAAAEAATQVHLPQDRNSRLTFSASHLDSTTGIGFGYAYMFDNDNRTALTASVGFAGDEAVVKVGVGFELGSKRMAAPSYTPVTYTAPPTAPGKVVVEESDYLALVAAVAVLQEKQKVQEVETDYATHDELAAYDAVTAQIDGRIEALENRLDAANRKRARDKVELTEIYLGDD